MMKKALILLLSLFVFWACANSLEEDAKEAARLQKKALDYSINNDEQSAKNYYIEVQEIIDKYRYTSNFREFDILYNEYLSTSDE